MEALYLVMRVPAILNEVEFWHLDPTAKAESVAHEIDLLIRRARAAGLSTTAYILEVAAQEARKGLHKDAPNASPDRE
jgi:hypothetical protein